MDQITCFALNSRLVLMFVIAFSKYFTLSEIESKKAFVLYIIHKQNLNYRLNATRTVQVTLRFSINKMDLKTQNLRIFKAAVKTIQKPMLLLNMTQEKDPM